jgi:hypothetical protein
LDIYSAYPPNFSFRFEWFETVPDEIEAGRESASAGFTAINPGPERTIAKEFPERKQKSQKRPEKCKFFAGVWKSPLKMQVCGGRPGIRTGLGEGRDFSSGLHGQPRVYGTPRGRDAFCPVREGFRCFCQCAGDDHERQ